MSHLCLVGSIARLFSSATQTPPNVEPALHLLREHLCLTAVQIMRVEGETLRPVARSGARLGPLQEAAEREAIARAASGIPGTCVSEFQASLWVPIHAPAVPVILYHHERWDGQGYPSGLKGEEIPIGARIVAIVDAFHAMTTTRSYHKARSDEAALEELQRSAGTHFDPTVVSAFVTLIQEVNAITEELDR